MSFPYQKKLAAVNKAACLAAYLCQKLQRSLLQSDVQSKLDKSPITVAYYGRSLKWKLGSEGYSTLRVITDEGISNDAKKMTLAESLASVVGECSCSEEIKPRSRKEIKRSLELSIKKRVKEQYVNGKFHKLVENVIAHPKTLENAYYCMRVDSNVEESSPVDDICFTSLAEELSNGSFDVKANTFSVSTKGARKEVLVLPNLKLKVVQEAMRIVLEVIYRPHFSKISHGGRNGRGHSSALKYICKEISNPDWWFTLHLNKKLDEQVLSKLISTMEDKIEDPCLYTVIERMFHAHVLNLEFGGFMKGLGLPQEGVLSPILMNIYLDNFDHEFYRMSMTYEALDSGSQIDENGPQSKLRAWFRRGLTSNNVNCTGKQKSSSRIYSCRFMDEIFFAVCGSKDATLSLRSEVQNYLQNFLHLDVINDTEIIACNDSQGVRFLGVLIKRTAQESPAVKAVHKLKDKIRLFAACKQEVWEAGTVRIGKKWLAHGLRKVKESEIKHLADSSSLLNKISCYRKSGMETDHWYKHLVKIWMQDMNVKAATGAEHILAKYIAEPALPPELQNSFYEFQKCVEEYISSETASLLSLCPSTNTPGQFDAITQVIAPVNVIKKRLLRYGLVNAEGYGRASSLLILLDSSQIIDWFSGIVCRWLRWYRDCDNFDDVKLIISGQVRKSCIRTLALKYRIHESEIEKQFDSELSRISSTLEIEQEMGKEILDSCAPDNDMASMYGISYSGLCLLSLARLVSYSRPCNCFVIGCLAPAQCVYAIHVMERQKIPGWKTGFSSCIHPSLNKRRMLVLLQTCSSVAIFIQPWSSFLLYKSEFPIKLCCWVSGMQTSSPCGPIYCCTMSPDMVAMKSGND
ncbi:hypothetical protein Nepgr_008540 [Nepenthes gracilis]|uniref:Domain X domain-containing protein n=1 Tax=Nepenthes gracilis TaxID=150966 RepID=A0AAD3S985_NEPGR|nr:hypothetical protein Nepgr_008540 [Nepenthes gracilis]